MKGWLKVKEAEAHCDVPCGIYDPVTAQVAAVSVTRFLDQIAETEAAGLDSAANLAKLARLTQQKEEHAAEVKAAVIVIWGDYFKPPHIEAHPEIHTVTHEIMRAASSCKQELDPANGRRLVDLVNQFADIFWATKNVETRRVKVPYEPKLEISQAVFEAA